MKIHLKLKIKNLKLNPRRTAISLVVFLTIGFLFLHYVGKTAATWYDDNYLYREKITIGNTAG